MSDAVAPDRSVDRRARFRYSDITFGFAAATLILAAIAGLFVRNLFFRLELIETVIHTHHVIQKLEELVTDVDEFESAALAYSLAGRTQYLAEYKAKLEQVEKDLRQVRALSANSAREREHQQRIETAVREIQRDFDLLVALPHAQVPADHFETEDALVVRGKQAVERFHAATERAQEEAEHLLDGRMTALKRTWNHTLILLLTGIVLSTAIMGWLFWTIRTESRRRRQVQQALERSHEELESRVRQRTLELVAANDRLSTLSRQIIQVQEDERRSLARDLHDEIGQSLTAVKLNLQEIEDRAEGTPARVLVRDSLELVGQLLQRVRSLALELRPSLLDEVGLYEASKWYVMQFAKRAALTVTFDADPQQERLPEEVEIACFRVIQEALTNIVRHAQATRVSVKLVHAGDSVEVCVTDDGVGFSLEAAKARARQGASLGLLGMEERLRLVGGTLDVASSEGRGTEVRARLPLAVLSQGRPAT
ncbi:MAG TPA: ATP-binding protein [Nitrospira sp.]|nr:ATP-binding protein [Nitrospira sp.]